MLSILIPIYNFKVEKLVRALMRQAHRLKIDYEILCFDDGSRKKIKYENSVLSDYFGVNYTELSENLGRARIRNWLAKSASFENLLFLDCDSKVISKSFLENYIHYIDDYDLVAGGRVYSKKAPRAKSKKLHWSYGKKFESMGLRKRQSDPWMNFHSNNFMVRREVLIDNPFDEDIKGYGYEDLEWAYAIAKKNYRLLHIDNPVEHLGIETAKEFLKKQKKSLQNLLRLNSEKSFETRLTRFCAKLKDWKISDLIHKHYAHKLPKLEEKLTTSVNSAYKFQFFKVIYFLDLKKNNI